jgi:hypothetical protein
MNLGDMLIAPQVLSDVVLVSPYNEGAIKCENDYDSKGGLVSFVFDVIGEQSSYIQTDITDHFIEDNSSIQDHVAIRPITVTVSGFQAELSNVTPPALEIIKKVIDKVASLQYYAPQLSVSAIRAYNIAFQLYQALENAKKAISKLTGIEEQSKQQIAYDYFIQRIADRKLFEIDTPYKKFTSMAILSVRATQSEQSRYITDFEITFKQIRTAQTSTVSTGTSPALLQSPSMLITNPIDKGIC